jgi:spore germination protein YaaH
MTRKTSRARLLITGLIAMAGFQASPCVFAEIPARKQPSPYQAWGYQPWWMHANWPAINLGLWDRALFFELQVEANGDIGNADALPSQWREMGRAAARCGSAFDLTFTLFDERKFEQLFSFGVARDKLLHNVLTLTESAGAMGVHLDFEIYGRVNEESVKGLRQFIARLHSSLRQSSPERMLSVFGAVGAAQDLYDRATLKNIDYVVIQGYDAHWKSGPSAGPVAPLKGRHKLTWEKSLQHYLQLGAERSRLLFSLPYYGYEWPVQSEAPGSATTAAGQEITYAPVPREQVPKISLSAQEQGKRYGVSRDPETGSPYYTYKDAQGTWRQGWFEDRASLAEKLAFIKRERLAGAAAFPLGYDAGNFDGLLASAFGKREDCPAGGASGKTP